MDWILAAAQWATTGHRRTMIVGGLPDGRSFVRLCDATKGEAIGYAQEPDDAAADALRQLTERERSAQ